MARTLTASLLVFAASSECALSQARPSQGMAQQASHPIAAPARALGQGVRPDENLAPLSETDAARRRETLMREWLRDFCLVDGHNDAPWQIFKRFNNQLGRFNFEGGTKALNPPMHTDLPRLRAGGVGGQFWSVFVPTSLHGAEAVQATINQMDLVVRLTARYPDSLGLASTADEVRALHRTGRVACLMGVEGGHSINNSLATLRQLHALGARYMTLTHWQNTAWADAATDKPAHHGLTPFGRLVVREMNRVGMLVDLSHVSPETMRDALDTTVAPVIFSHSSAYALCKHVRNVPDEILKRVARNGGVVMVNYSSIFVSEAARVVDEARDAEEERLTRLHPTNPGAVTAALAAYDRVHPMPRATLTQVADHLDHIRRVAGIEHVGLGADLDGIERTPIGLPDTSAYPALLAELYRRGYTKEDLAALAGNNVLRVLERARRVAERLQGEVPACDARLEDVDTKPKNSTKPR